MSFGGSPRVDLSRQVKKMMTGRGSSTSRWSSGGKRGRRLVPPRFPAMEGWSLARTSRGGSYGDEGASVAVDLREMVRRRRSMEGADALFLVSGG